MREKLLRLLDKEIPHGIAVVVERMREREDSSGITNIEATIYCERDSHKAIIIGKQGSMLKRVGSYARSDMEAFFDRKINLQLWVKVKEDWRNRKVFCIIWVMIKPILNNRQWNVPLLSLGNGSGTIPHFG